MFSWVSNFCSEYPLKGSIVAKSVGADPINSVEPQNKRKKEIKKEKKNSNSQKNVVAECPPIPSIPRFTLF